MTRVAALALVGLILQLGRLKAFAFEDCYSQAQCKSQEFCGVDPNQHGRSSCVSSDAWPLTSAMTASDSNTGVYGLSFVATSGGAMPLRPTSPDYSGVCVTITRVHPSAASSGQVVAKVRCDKKGHFRIALPPGDYWLEGRGDSQTVHVTQGIFQWAPLVKYLMVP